MAASQQPGDTGSMRRLHEAIIRSGVLGKIGSEGRLVFAIALCWADYKSCAFTFSARGAAKIACVEVTSVRRGLRQLAKAGIIQQSTKQVGIRRRFRFCVPSAETVPTIGTDATDEARTPCVRPRARSVCAPVTQRVRGAHTVCAPRTRSVPPIPQLSSRTPQGVREGGRAQPDGRAGPEEIQDGAA
jgi:hypothetical protein